VSLSSGFSVSAALLGVQLFIPFRHALMGVQLSRLIGDRRALADARVDARIALATRAIAEFGAVEADGELGRQVGDWAR